MGHHLPAACLVLFAVDDQSSLDQVAQFPESWQLCIVVKIELNAWYAV